MQSTRTLADGLSEDFTGAQRLAWAQQDSCRSHRSTWSPALQAGVLLRRDEDLELAGAFLDLALDHDGARTRTQS